MKHSLLSIPVFALLFIFINSCTNSSDSGAYFKGVNWYQGEKLILRSDSAVSYSQFNELTASFYNDSAFYLFYTDSTLVYTRYEKRGVFNANKDFQVSHCEKVTDTVLYDFLYINNKPKLVMYLEPFPIILSTKQKLSLPETQNFKPTRFVISDYSIGDKIDRSQLKTKGIYNYPNYTIEDCEYVENNNITFKIIGYNTIYSIERKRIEDYRVDDVLEVISTKINKDPNYRPMRKWLDGSDYEYEFYRWTGNGVQVNLSRSKYIGSDSYKTLIEDSQWNLTYDDSFIQALLVETYLNGKHESSIIN